MTDTEYVREIARIESTMLGFEDHGILTAVLQVTYGHVSQGVGGYDLRPGNGAYAAEWIERALNACGVRAWEKLQGRTIYVLKQSGRVVGIEPLPTEPGRQFLFGDAIPGGAS